MPTASVIGNDNTHLKKIWVVPCLTHSSAHQMDPVHGMNWEPAIDALWQAGEGAAAEVTPLKEETHGALLSSQEPASSMDEPWLQRAPLASVSWKTSIIYHFMIHRMPKFKNTKNKWGTIKGSWLSNPLELSRDTGLVDLHKQGYSYFCCEGGERKEGRGGERKNTGHFCRTLKKNVMNLKTLWQKEKKLERIGRTQELTESSRLKAMYPKRSK